MNPLPNNPRSSLQRFRSVMTRALMKGFKPKSGGDKLVSEVVRAITGTLEKHLVDFGSETVDQVCGRLETRLNALQKGLTVSDETVEGVRSGLESEKAEPDLIDAVCKVLNGINKDDKLKGLREYLETDRKNNRKKKKKEGKADISLRNSRLARNFYFQIEKAILVGMKPVGLRYVKFADITKKITGRIDKMIKQDLAELAENKAIAKATRSMIKTVNDIASERVKLRKETISRAGKNIRLAKSYAIDAGQLIVSSVKSVVECVKTLFQVVTLLVKAVVFSFNIGMAVISFSADLFGAFFSALA